MQQQRKAYEGWTPRRLVSDRRRGEREKKKQSYWPINSAQAHQSVMRGGHLFFPYPRGAIMCSCLIGFTKQRNPRAGLLFKQEILSYSACHTRMHYAVIHRGIMSLQLNGLFAKRKVTVADRPSQSGIKNTCLFDDDVFDICTCGVAIHFLCRE